jgi:signal transduction histidine kinase/ActR/RegA family two-component response regulator
MERIDHLAVPAAGEGGSWSELGALGPPFPLHAALVLPLRARNQVLGSLSLVLGHSDRSFGAAETLLAEDLAGRAAVFMDNARLYRDIQESDARKNEFLAMLAHELRNPLAAIRGAVHVLCLGEPGKDKVAWARAIIDRQVNQLVRLVDDLLDVARITQGKIRLQMELVELATIVEMAKELSLPLIEARQHTLTLHQPDEPLWVRGDAARLAQVLSNLLNNAAKYTDKGGSIVLSVERADDLAIIRVRDNGIGIPAEMVDAIFDLFTQANRSLDRAQGGLGIGLTLVRHIVEMHDGSVAVASAGYGQGSEFTIRLPLHTEPVVLPPEEEPPPPPEKRQRRVLVVDDNLDVADSLASMLRQHGHEVTLAHDGPAALAMAPGLRPQVVLLDIGLPGLDGYEVARRLRAMPELSDTLLIALTGYGQPEAKRTADEAGFHVHLVKPVNPATLETIMSGKPPDRRD